MELLRVITSSYELLRVITSYHELLRVVTSCCELLRVVTSSYKLLRVLSTNPMSSLFCTCGYADIMLFIWSWADRNTRK